MGFSRHSFLLRAVLCLGTLPSVPAGAADARLAMGDAMLRMMETMGFLQPGISSAMTYGMGAMPNWNNALPGTLNTTPWPYALPDATVPDGWKLKGCLPGESGITGLDGIWEGRDGELFIIHGNRFRLYSPNSLFVDGLIRRDDGHIALYNPNRQQARPYEVAEQDGRLVLRDSAGQLLLYRRLWLDAGSADPDAATATVRRPLKELFEEPAPTTPSPETESSSVLTDAER